MVIINEDVQELMQVNAPALVVLYDHFLLSCSMFCL